MLLAKLMQLYYRPSSHDVDVFDDVGVVDEDEDEDYDDNGNDLYDDDEDDDVNNDDKHECHDCV